MAALKDVLQRFLAIIIGLILLPFVLPLIIVAKLYHWIFVPFSDRTPEEVAENLTGILAGESSDDHWDDLDNIPIREPRLESIRKQALAVSNPLDDKGRTILAALLVRTEASAKEISAGPERA